jgi:hypothetical protein
MFLGVRTTLIVPFQNNKPAFRIQKPMSASAAVDSVKIGRCLSNPHAEQRRSYQQAHNHSQE